MEENSESHKEAAVSSSTDDVVPAPEPAPVPASPRRSLETTVVVEKVQEEEMSSTSKDKPKEQFPQTEKPPENDSPKASEKFSQKEMPLKKIIIKTANKDFQIVKIVTKSGTKVNEGQTYKTVDPVQTSPKTDRSPKVLTQVAPPVKVIPSTVDLPINKKDHIIKVKGPAKVSDNVQSNQIMPVKDVKTTSLNNSSSIVAKASAVEAKVSPIKEAEVKEYKISPVKESFNKDSELSTPSLQPGNVSLNKDGAAKVSPFKITLKRSPVKNVQSTPTKVMSGKDQPKEVAKVSPVKEDSKEVEKVTPVKEQSKEVEKVTPVKEHSKEVEKVTPVKEHSKEVEKVMPVKEQSKEVEKVTPVKKQSKEVAKVTPFKEQPKEVAKVTSVKEQDTKTNADKIQVSNIKELSNEKVPSVTPESSKVASKGSNAITTVDVDKEASNDSQIETNSDTSEKEHKGISRELKSLIKSAKESKIISECTQLTSKTRKSRTPLDTSSTSLNNSLDADKIQGVRRGSDNSQASECSEKSEKGLKRSMRSHNPEFVNKVKMFLNSVTGKSQKEQESSDEEVDEKKEEVKPKESTEPRTYPVKKQQKNENSDTTKSQKLLKDPYCWRCHWSVDPQENEKAQHPPLQCTVCPRSFHYKCLSIAERSKIIQDKSWVCPECLAILAAESSETRSLAMKKISLGMLCELLKYALERMMDINGVEPFVNPVDRSTFPDYDKYVVHPMYLSLMRDNINAGYYGSTEAFIADAQWILHNSIIFNTLQSKLTSGARALVRSCRAEMGEIEACPECYSAAHARKPTWFTDVCSTPHILLWAKLKGFPYWPAKGMTVSSAGLVDVRFFGAHDRAWVPAKDCFLYSEKDPNNFRTKRQDILDSMQEAEHHIRSISRKYGKFVYPPFKTQFEPAKLNEQLKLMIPSFEGECRAPVKDNSSPRMVKEKRSNSKSSKGSHNDCDVSEGEETPVKTRKMTCGREIARDEDDVNSSIDKDKSKEKDNEKEKQKEKEKPMEVDSPQVKESEASRKRRRSDLEEAVITIIDNKTKEKKKRVNSEEKQETKEVNKSEKKEITETPKENKPTDTSTPKRKDSEPSTSSAGKPGKPTRLISIEKVLKTTKVNTPKVSSPKETEKPPPKKQRTDDTPDKATPTEDKLRTLRRRSSKGNKSLNSSSTEKTEKKAEKVEKQKTYSKIDSEKSTKSDSVNSKKTQFDDDTSLAVLARETAKTNPIPATITRLPTISSVRSLSGTPDIDIASNEKGRELTVEAPSDSSIFTPTSSNNVRNVKEAADKLQKLRSDDPPPPPLVGRVGVRAFARMTSPPKETRPNNDVSVEIKTEPVDFEDADRQMEKMDLMNAFQLRPVNGPAKPTQAQALRDVRINKVVVTPVPKKPESRPRAKKSFPNQKKDDGRSELNSKNSMVYIPIQPPQPTAQTTFRPQRPNTNVPPLIPANVRPIAPAVSNQNNSNAPSTPLPPMPIPALSQSTPMPIPNQPANTVVQNSPTVGPTTVHTVPIMTSVNGQWTFSLQPVISVGAVDNAPPAPMVNGLERPRPMAPLTSLPAPVPVPLPAQLPASLAAQLPAPGPTTVAVDADNATPGEPPRLQQRPQLLNPLDVNAPAGNIPTPSSAGPLTAKLNQNAVKIADFFRTLLEESIEKVDEPVAQLTKLKMEMEALTWKHQQEMQELKHNNELAISEMRSSFEKEKARLLSETRRAAQIEQEAAVKLAKSKQWCAKCSQEAQFYCCWNTSYCDYSCQRAHWSQHFAVCTQRMSQDGSNESSTDSPESRRHGHPLPKTTAAPNLVAGKMPPNRVFAKDQSQPTQKSSIIMSMVEDPTSGTQSVKCVGTYEPPAPHIINKQLNIKDDSAKKVVTSGGYLIVGAANSTQGNVNNSTSVVNTNKRKIVHYFSP